MTWKAGLTIPVALALIFAGLPKMSLYLVEEALTVLLVIAALLILILLTVSVLLLLWQGASLVFLRMKGVVGITSIRARPLTAEQAISPQLLHH